MKTIDFDFRFPADWLYFNESQKSLDPPLASPPAHIPTFRKGSKFSKRARMTLIHVEVAQAAKHIIGGLNLGAAKVCAAGLSHCRNKLLRV